MNIAIVGAGYVGLVTGISLAKFGAHRVTFIETAAAKRESIESGSLPISEPGLDDAFAAVRDRVEVLPSLEELPVEPDLVLVAVATPIDEHGEPDLGQIYDVAAALRRWPQLHVCVRSTLPPGTSARLPALLGRENGARISTNPEFLRQGSALADYEKPARVVIGKFAETDAEHLDRVRNILAAVDAPVLEVSVEAAELIKNVANGFLALKLSFVNEVSSLSEEYGVDVEEVLRAIALDPRIGSTYMRPGLGFGGSCLPKELQVLTAAGRRQGLSMHVARAASLVNAEQQDRFARRIIREVGPSPKTIAVLGLSFKAGTDDLRGSPALTVARRLQQSGHRLKVHDPVVPTERVQDQLPGVEHVESAMCALEGADVAIIATEWPEYADLSWTDAASIMHGRLIYDGRNLLDPQSVAGAGFAYRGVGRPSVDASPPMLDSAAVGGTSRL